MVGALGASVADVGARRKGDLALVPEIALPAEIPRIRIERRQGHGSVAGGRVLGVESGPMPGDGGTSVGGVENRERLKPFAVICAGVFDEAPAPLEHRTHGLNHLLVWSRDRNTGKNNGVSAPGRKVGAGVVKSNRAVSGKDGGDGPKGDGGVSGGAKGVHNESVTEVANSSGGGGGDTVVMRTLQKGLNGGIVASLVGILDIADALAGINHLDGTLSRSLVA